MEKIQSKPTLAQLKEKPHYSYSALNTYINICQLQYYYRYIEKLEPEQTPVALPFGTAFHQVLSEQAQYAKNGKLMTSEEMSDAFSVYFKANCNVSENVVYKKDETYDDQITTARRMFDVMNREWMDYYNIQSVAEPFSVTIPGLSKTVIGELDMVITEQTPFDEDKSEAYPVIVDFKTAARMWPEDKASRDLQATVFSYAYSRLNDINPAFRFDVITKAKTPTVKHFYTGRSENDYQRLEKLFVTADKAIQTGVFMPNETSFACADCPFAGQCSNWHCTSLDASSKEAA